MGRHTSADEDATAVPVTAELPARHRSVRRGRHLSADDEDAPDSDEQMTQVTAVVDPADGVDVAANVDHAEDRRDTDEFPVPHDIEPPTSMPESKQRSESGTRADLRLLRNNAAVRARCIAAAVAPFVLYTVVMVIIGRTNAYLVWIWIPIVLAGVLVGLFLDLAQRDVGQDGA